MHPSIPSRRITAAIGGGLLVAAAVVVVIVLSSSNTSSASPASRPAGQAAVPASETLATTTISVRRTSLGPILVGAGGRTLYAFSRDRGHHEACAAVRGCAAVWPLVIGHGQVHAGRGVRGSLLRTIVVGGQRQLVYAGHPLYGYVADGGPASTEYVGVSQFGGTWPALSPSGRIVTNGHGHGHVTGAPATRTTSGSGGSGSGW